jgi:hypothetical protein
MGLHSRFLAWKRRIVSSETVRAFQLTRRQFLHGSAVTALTHDIPRVLLGRRISFVHQQQRAAFLLDGVESWILNTADFAGEPRLQIQESKAKQIALTLSGARLPGTQVAFDMDIHVEPRLFGWSCTISFPKCNITRRVDLQRWLEGQAVQWVRSSGEELLSCDAPVQIEAIGQRTIHLDCHWNMEVKGNLLVHLPGQEGTLPLHGIQLAVANDVDEIPLASHQGLHTRLKGCTSQPWLSSVAPLLEVPFIEFRTGSGLFNRLSIDAWEPGNEGPRFALSLTGEQLPASEALLHGEMKDLEGTRPVLSLVRPNYAFSIDGARRESVFFASLERPVTVYSDSHAAVLHGELAINQNTDQSPTCCATVETKQLYVGAKHFQHPDGTLFEFALPAGYRLPALHLGHRVSGVERGWDAINEFFVSLFTKDKFEAPLDGVTVRMLRPEDTLNLTFSFEGLKLKMHAGIPYLERLPLPGGGFATAYLKVDLPSQNLQEESFFEDNLGQSGGQPSPSPSVKTSAAGPSWLRFRLEPAVFRNGLPFSTESLLNWKNFSFVPGDRQRASKGSRIEVPYRLYLTPGQQIMFQHNLLPQKSVTVNRTPDETADVTRAAELWGTLLHESRNATEEGEDLEAIEMMAFGASDLAEILKVKIVSPSSVQALLGHKVPVQVGKAVMYRTGSTKYLGSTQEVTIEKIFTAPDGTVGIQYTFAQASFSRTNADFVAPDVDLWLLPLSLAAPLQQSGTEAVPSSTNQVQIGGVSNPPCDAMDRAQIVAITSLTEPPRNGIRPQRLNVNRLELTALGAYFDTDNNFSDQSVLAIDKFIDLRAWKHLTVLGRDSFVELKYAGFLWPFAHKAQFIKRTKRVFFSVLPIDPQCNRSQLFCYLRQQYFVQIKEKTRYYYRDKPVSTTWNFPFPRVDINTSETPPLLPPNNSAYPAAAQGDTWKAFVPQIDLKTGQTIVASDVYFDLTGYDWANPGVAVPFKAPLVFVRSSENVSGTFAGDAGPIEADLYEKNGRNIVSFGEQHIHFAPSIAPGDTEQQVQSIAFEGITFASPDTTGVYSNFYPAMKSASVDFPSIRSLTGAPSATYSTVAYETSSYTGNGFGDASANPAGIYLTIVGGPQRSLEFPGQHGGGIAKPTIPLKTVSRTKGAMSFGISATVSTQTNGQLSAQDFFAAIGLGPNIFPKLFGVIPLQDLLLAAADNVPAGLNPFTCDSLPSTLTKLIDGASLLCQQLQNLYDTYYKPVSDLLQLIADIRALTTQRSLDALKQQAQEALVAVIHQQVQAAQDQLNQLVTKAENDLIQTVTREAALQANIVERIKLACDQVQQTLMTEITGFVGTIADLLNEALGAVVDTVFKVEGVLGTLRSVLDNVRNAPDKVVAQLKSLEQDITVFASNDLVASLKTGGANSGDLLKQFLKEELQKELTAGQSLLLGFGLNLDSPIREFQQSFDRTVDAGAALYNNAYTQATNAVQSPAKAIADAASSAYIDHFLQTADIVNNAVTNIEHTVITKVTETITGAVTQIVSSVLADSTLATEITQDVDAAIKVASFIVEVADYVQRLKDILNQPVSYGVDYDLPLLPLKSRGIFIGHSEDSQKNASLAIQARINAYVVPADLLRGKGFKPRIDYNVLSTIQNFGIGLFSGASTESFITLYVKSITFSTTNQQHPNVDFKLGTVSFGGDLGYIADLASSFGILGSGKSGPLIAVSATGIDLGWTFSLPDLAAGGFRITGLAFGFAVHLPFDDQPLKMRFYFARPEKHFTASAGIYGGGGFLMLEGGPTLSQPGQGAQCTAIDAFQLCLEFGATTALQLAAASGEAHIMAGTYITVQDGACKMSGFVRAGGSLNIIHILTVSLEIYIGISYDLQNNNIVGKGSVTVSISIAFFSVDVTVGMSWTWNRSGGGGNANLVMPQSLGFPTRAHAGKHFFLMGTSDTDASETGPVRMRHMTEGQWNEYANVF